MPSLSPFISEKFNGVIWRLEIDGLADTAFVEIRNSEDKVVSFASINLLTGQTNFTRLVTEERWMTGIEAAYDGVLLLHNYQSANSPVHKGLIAVDGITSKILWSNYTYGFEQLSINGPVIYNMQVQPKKLVVADIKIGIVKRNYEPAIDTEPVIQLAFPRVINAADYNEPLLQMELFGNSVNYWEHNNLRIVSLHTQTKNGLQQHLYIMDGAQVVFEDIMNNDIQKLQPEAFILYKNCLLYIKNKHQLKALNL